ncbi:PP2C family protein-serine/threonine phosphatase [Actinokineospora inagensis]|uniref:PP2C family protein-serine/threonine phosphatase n=1 Tax=Actinokineospora inagensis TaxID=103730 RepID=UPI000478E196|nr:GAF domain-containing SpoIIE family protein phosphatase [Actinokineospora inagensis]
MSSGSDRLRVLEVVTDRALEHLELGEFLQEILGRVRELFDVDTATVLLYEPATDLLRVSAAVGSSEEVLQGITVPVGVGFSGGVAAAREPIVVDQVDSESVGPLLWSQGVRVLLGVPMLARGELVGVLHIGRRAVRRFDASDIESLRLVADRVALVTQMETARTERAATGALQRSLLPALLPSVPGLQLAARYLPGTQTAVGGDWYDVFGLPGDRFGIVMGDVAGHGLPAAVVMGRLRSALRAYALDYDSPAKVLTKLNRKATHFEHGAMATVSYGIVDRSRERLTLSLAGHPPPVLAAPGEASRLVEIPADPPIGLGLRDLGERRDTVVCLPPGSVIAFYTDGLVERRGVAIDASLAGLAATVVPAPPDTVCSRVMTALVDREDTRDDIALLVARRS